MNRHLRRYRLGALAAALALVVAGCAARSAFHRGRGFADAEDWDQAVYFYSKALAREPRNIEYRKALEHAKVKASQQHAELARSYQETGALDLAIAEWRVAASLDPTNRFVADSLANALERRREQDEAPQTKSDLERLKDEAKGSGATPVLQPASDAPLTLNFPPNTKVKDIYTALGKAAGINFLFDSGIRDQETFSIDIANTSFRKALDQVAIANKHFYKVIDERTLMVIPDNPQKRRDYEDNVIKTFYLSNAAPNDVVNTLRGLLDARRLAVNPSLNAITIRDTPAKIAVMERIIESNDKPPSEVVIDVEIVEVSKSRSLTLGTGLSAYAVTEVLEQPDEVGGVKGLRLSSLPFLNASDWLLSFPSLTYEARKNAGEIRTLARPSLRALDGKQVTLRLGDQVPIETSTFSATTGGTVPLTRNFQFRDIGTNIDITPRVHHNNEVTLQLQVEVTSVGEDPDGGSGPIPPKFGNRRINTEIRLKDGETNLLAGLFTSSEDRGRDGLPILSDLPVLRTFLTRNSRTHRETDIVLTLTPHIVRTPNIRKSDLEPFYVGTEANIGGVGDVGLGGAFGAGEGGEAAPGQAPPGAPGARPTPPRPGARTPGTAAPGAPVRPGSEPAPMPGRPSFVFPEGAPRPQPTPPPVPGQQGTGDEQTPGRAVPERALPEGGGVAPGEIVPPPPTPVPAGERISRADPGRGRTPGSEEPPAGRAGAPPPASTLAAAAKVAEARVEVEPRDVFASADHEFAVTVRITGASGVAHAPFWLVFDPAVVEFVSGEEGAFLRADAAPTEFFVSPRGAGRVAVGVSRLGGGGGAWGAGDLATFRFRARASGKSALVLESASLRDPGGAVLPATFTGATIVVP